MMSDYDQTIKNHQFRIAELIYETAQHQLLHRKSQILIAEFGIEIARLNSHIQVLETTLAAMSGELHALRMDTQ